VPCLSSSLPFPARGPSLFFSSLSLSSPATFTLDRLSFRPGERAKTHGLFSESALSPPLKRVPPIRQGMSRGNRRSRFVSRRLHSCRRPEEKGRPQLPRGELAGTARIVLPSREKFQKHASFLRLRARRGRGSIMARKLRKELSRYPNSRVSRYGVPRDLRHDRRTRARNC